MAALARLLCATSSAAAAATGVSARARGRRCRRSRAAAAAGAGRGGGPARPLSNGRGASESEWSDTDGYSSGSDTDKIAHSTAVSCPLPPPPLVKDAALGDSASASADARASDVAAGAVAADEEVAAPSALEGDANSVGKREFAEPATPAAVAVEDDSPGAIVTSGKTRYVTKPLPSVLILHTGGTLGMDPEASYVSTAGVENATEAMSDVHLREGTGGVYPGGLQPGPLLANLLHAVPEVNSFANVDMRVLFNTDSSRVGPREWKKIAKELDKRRNQYDGFVLVHGTDTLSYTASALSLMLAGFKKPIVVTGSQLPIAMPRTDARANLIDSISCATDPRLQEVAVCFGGRLLRGNRSQKVNASSYSAFDSPSYRHLATLGVDIDWHEEYMLRSVGTYRPRFKLDANVIRVPIVPGSDPRFAYGDIYGRGVRGIVLEVFGVGNMPDTVKAGWLPWLEEQCSKGLKVYLTSQCAAGRLHPELYQSGTAAMLLGCEGGPQMTPECAVVKMMLHLAHKDIPLAQPLAGEL